MLIFRFLQITSLAHLCSIFFEMVSCHSLPIDLERDGRTILEDSKHIRRTYKLYNQCSGNHIQIFGTTVDAKGHSNSSNAKLSFILAKVRHAPDAMNIMGEKSGRYLCFNKRGKLITRFNGRKKLCLFKEGFGFGEEHNTVLQSIYDPTWYVGFNKKGRPLKGSLHSKAKLRDCFLFVKRDHSYSLLETQHPGPKIKNPSKTLKDLLTGRRSIRPRRVVPRTPTR
ncbi:fibroblast growth factor 8b-like [Uloborus diversus]|uniref:fibroblast growth factor 8b-like n=1 Tax=Uloborus diversus TaxID=327109 RepID=UPI00240A4566|nr:fibroblast growth factor 8b-like [Uloborus diversus]